MPVGGTRDASNSFTNQAAGAGTGLVVDLGAVYSQLVLALIANVGISAGVVDLEGSLDGTNFYKIVSAAAFTAPGVTVVTATMPARFARARISTNTVGGTFSAQIGAGA